MSADFAAGIREAITSGGFVIGGHPEVPAARFTNALLLYQLCSTFD